MEESPTTSLVVSLPERHLLPMLARARSLSIPPSLSLALSRFSRFSLSSFFLSLSFSRSLSPSRAPSPSLSRLVGRGCLCPAHLGAHSAAGCSSKSYGATDNFWRRCRASRWGTGASRPRQWTHGGAWSSSSQPWCGHAPLRPAPLHPLLGAPLRERHKYAGPRAAPVVLRASLSHASRWCRRRRSCSRYGASRHGGP